MAFEEAEEKIEVMYQSPQRACVVLVAVHVSFDMPPSSQLRMALLHHRHISASYSPQASAKPAPSKPLQSPPHSH